VPRVCSGVDMSFRTGGLAFWIKDFTRPEMWPFVAGFGVVNLLAWKYLKFADDLPDRKDSNYARQIDRARGRIPPEEHGHDGHGKAAAHH